MLMNGFWKKKSLKEGLNKSKAVSGGTIRATSKNSPGSLEETIGWSPKEKPWGNSWKIFPRNPIQKLLEKKNCQGMHPEMF